MSAALVAGDGVNFVDDDGAHGRQGAAAAVGGQQDVERFGRGDQDVRRLFGELLPLGHRGVAGADRDANLRHAEAFGPRARGDFRQRSFEVALHIVR